MEHIVNIRVYYNGEIIQNTHKGVAFVCKCQFLFAISYSTSFIELQNSLCVNIQSHISKRVSNILYRNPVQVFGGLIQFQIIKHAANVLYLRQTRFYVPVIELYIEFEQHTGLDAFDEEVYVDKLGDIDWEEANNVSEEEFEANYEVDDENDDRDLASNSAVQIKADGIVSQHPFGVLSFMRTLDLKAMHAPKFPEYANMGEGNNAAEDGEFSVGMKFSLRESVISAIKSYTISRGVDYTMYEFEPQTFYAKCKGYGAGYFRMEQEELKKAFNVQETLWPTDSTGATRCLRFTKCKIVPFTLLTFAQRHSGCGHFQVERLSCRHVLACCTNQCLNWQVYVHDVYKMSENCKVYKGEFVPMGDPSTWDRYEGAKVIAN
ncbi:hypothetical protein Ahy_A09g044955 [Arachis hypogaea]|uniref:SWIM-type domain-containing protein n=1 Tax=Arachis hypogaea TaxID=3818 RepID=A0A445BL58_ARAHY|nr:hypothetical protein Ahy_A09g044955 [Arachis hypogaea]